MSSIIPAWSDIFAVQKARAERAIAQLTDDELFAEPAPGMNPVAVIMRHVAGNLRSRFTDFLTTDGEKPWRHRDTEFDPTPCPRAELMARWNEGWACLLDAVGALAEHDLTSTVTIRGEPHSVPKAINRAIDHMGYHVGQIVTFSRMLVSAAGREWNHLSIPPGGSATFNAGMAQKFGQKA